MQKCQKCGVSKADTEFAKHYENGKVTLRHTCKDCYNARRRGEPVYNKDKSDIISAFLDACNYDPSNINNIPEAKFRRCFHVGKLPFNFQELKAAALEQLSVLGYCNPTTVDLDDNGKYLIIGDLFGKKTSTAKFKMLFNIVSTYDIKAVIAIGHLTDDYNDISNMFSKFTVPVYMVPMKNELKDVQRFCASNINANIILDKITIGDVTVATQENITPYSKLALSSVDPIIYSGKCIVNCTRHELYTRPSTYGASWVASPGAMAEPHVIRTVYKLILSSGKRIDTKMNRDSFLKYRKNNIDKELWECGCIVVDYEDGETDTEMIRIMDDNTCVLREGYYITPECIEPIEPTTAILSDLHISEKDDNNFLEEVADCIEDNNCKEVIINGDLFNCLSFNHHDPLEASTGNFLEELNNVNRYLKRLSDTGADILVLRGNHEAFLNRWLKQYPQLASLIERDIYNTITEYAEYDELCKHDDVVLLENDLKLTHGSSKIFGGRGSQIEQVARYIGNPCIMGHTHSPAIRFGVYCSGCLCSIDQGYNNSSTTNWLPGFILVFNKNGKSYIHQVLL